MRAHDPHVQVRHVLLRSNHCTIVFIEKVQAFARSQKLDQRKNSYYAPDTFSVQVATAATETTKALILVLAADRWIDGHTDNG
jgi:hypothetical protein